MSEDLISRQAAIDATELLIKDLRKDTVDVMNFGHNYNHGVADAIATLKHLPSTERHGRWIYKDIWSVFECSCCGRTMVRNSYLYCPWCGAKMQGDADE